MSLIQNISNSIETLNLLQQKDPDLLEVAPRLNHHQSNTSSVPKVLNGLMGEIGIIAEDDTETESVEKEETKIPLEDQCGSCNVNIATHGCKICGFIFCLSCAMQYHKWGTFTDHKLYDLNEARRRTWVAEHLRKGAVRRLTEIVIDKNSEQKTVVEHRVTGVNKAVKRFNKMRGPKGNAPSTATEKST